MTTPHTLIPVSAEQVLALHGRWQQRANLRQPDVQALLAQAGPGVTEIQVRCQIRQEWTYAAITLIGSAFPQPMKLERPFQDTDSENDSDSNAEDERAHVLCRLISGGQLREADTHPLSEIIGSFRRCPDRSDQDLFRNLIYWHVVNALPDVIDLWVKGERVEVPLKLCRYTPLPPFPALYLDAVLARQLEPSEH